MRHLFMITAVALMSCARSDADAALPPDRAGSLPCVESAVETSAGATYRALSQSDLSASERQVVARFLSGLTEASPSADGIAAPLLYLPQTVPHEEAREQLRACAASLGVDLARTDRVVDGPRGRVLVFSAMDAVNHGLGAERDGFAELTSFDVATKQERNRVIRWRNDQWEALLDPLADEPIMTREEALSDVVPEELHDVPHYAVIGDVLIRTRPGPHRAGQGYVPNYLANAREYELVGAGLLASFYTLEDAR